MSILGSNLGMRVSARKINAGSATSASAHNESNCDSAGRPEAPEDSKSAAQVSCVTGSTAVIDTATTRVQNTFNVDKTNEQASTPAQPEQQRVALHAQPRVEARAGNQSATALAPSHVQQKSTDQRVERSNSATTRSIDVDDASNCPEHNLKDQETMLGTAQSRSDGSAADSAILNVLAFLLSNNPPSDGFPAPSDPRVLQQATFTKSQKSKSSFADFPKDVRARILSLVLQSHNGSLVVFDKRVESTTKRAPRLWYTLNGKRYTYAFGRLASANHIEPTGINTSIMRASRAIYKESRKHLYGQQIIFCGSAEGATAWLHDVSWDLLVVRSLGFHYRYQHGTAAVYPSAGNSVPLWKTSEHGYRRLMNTLVHKCAGLAEFVLHIDGNFWSAVAWGRGAEDVLDWRESYCAKSLTQIARLALFDRISARCQRGNNGVVLTIDIKDTDTPEKVAFESKVQDLIGKRRARRGRIAEVRVCKCKALAYEECCYVKLPKDEAKSPCESGLCKCTFCLLRKEEERELYDD